ncbi:hypothetical protein AVEN_136130-1 [Araneus ventricosus]|uniref:Uncharacterized protein n=1 Tax=Araneus ventricosus TaxID=182803 RepID=A0A4Y2PWR4_ARAVE|nr:hypothetical protein AVEN_136130-1 [Araneus ventricosus]
MNDSATSEKVLNTPKDMHSVPYLLSSSTIRTEQPNSHTIPDLTSDSEGSSDFKTVTKKKIPKTSPKITTENQRQLNSEKTSKFWTTSPLQVLTSATMQIDDSFLQWMQRIASKSLMKPHLRLLTPPRDLYQ